MTESYKQLEELLVQQQYSIFKLEEDNVIMNSKIESSKLSILTTLKKIEEKGLANKTHSDTENHSLTKKMRLKKLGWKNLLYSGTHGLSRIILSDNIIVKIVWTILTTISAIGCIYFLEKEFIDYFSYNVITQTKKISYYDKPFYFPAVTICSTNNYTHLKSAVKMSKFFDKYDLHFEVFREVYFKIGMYCMRFNGPDGELIEAQPDTSFKAGFEIILTEWEVQVFVTENNVNVFEHRMRFYAEIETETQLYFKKTVDKKLGLPYNKCTEMKDETYRQENCFEECFQKKLFNRFNCTYYGYYMIKGVNQICDFDFYKDNKYLIFSECNNTKECPLECVTTEYDVSIVQKRNKGDKRITINQTKILAFLSELNYLELTQIPKTTGSAMLSVIGGTIGLFFGVSMLSFAQIIEFVIEVLSVWNENFDRSVRLSKKRRVTDINN